jgi:hypothetical protein
LDYKEDIIIHVTEANISHGIGQSTVQHAFMQCNKRNRKKRSYDDADLYVLHYFNWYANETKPKRFKMEKCGNILTSLIFLTPDIDWIMTKVILKGNSNGGNVEVRVCLPRLDLIPINKVSLSRGDIREPVSKLLLQIKGLLEEQKNSLVSGKRHRSCQ